MAHKMACSFPVCLCDLNQAVLFLLLCREGSLNAPTVDAEDVLAKCSFWTSGLFSVGQQGSPSFHLCIIITPKQRLSSFQSETNH